MIVLSNTIRKSLCHCRLQAAGSNYCLILTSQVPGLTERCSQFSRNSVCLLYYKKEKTCMSGRPLPWCSASHSINNFNIVVQ